MTTLIGKTFARRKFARYFMLFREYCRIDSTAKDYYGVKRLDMNILTQNFESYQGVFKICALEPLGDLSNLRYLRHLQGT